MPRESLKSKKERTLKLIKLLEASYPHAHCALDYTNPLELLVATILSAQCTDERVNIVTKKLFRRCKSAKDYAQIPQEELEEIIHSAGFYKNKAKSLRGMGQALVDCAILDDSRLVCTLEEDFGLCRFPPGRLPVKGVAALHESRIAALICRARRMRLLELSFLTWAEQSAVYKPVIVDGKTTAPKRMRDEFENDSGLRGCDIRL